MKRGLLNAAAILSMALSFLLAALWVRSQGRSDKLSWVRSSTYTEQLTVVSRGGSILIRVFTPWRPGGKFWHHESDWVLHQADSRFSGALWFQFGVLDVPNAPPSYSVALPHWVFCVCFAIPPAWSVYRRLRRRQANDCPACNYDLRGTPGSECPECGAKREAKA